MLDLDALAHLDAALAGEVLAEALGGTDEDHGALAHPASVPAARCPHLARMGAE